MTSRPVFEGPLQTLEVFASPDTADAQVHYLLNGIALDALLNQTVAIRWLGGVVCGACSRATSKSYGNGYCYRCFTTLARCDLCIVSPTRCHFAAGTCREPDWAVSHCMSPHYVYLANTSGVKVGLTRANRIPQRWLDQGAVQGLVIAQTDTRQAAGALEALLAGRLSDRTIWQHLVSGDPEPVDLKRIAASLHHLPLPAGCEWIDTQPYAFNYPVRGFAPPVQLALASSQTEVAGLLRGIKGQYLLFAHGVFNVPRHLGYRVQITVDEHANPMLGDTQQAQVTDRDQMELF